MLPIEIYTYPGIMSTDDFMIFMGSMQNRGGRGLQLC
jgi:hypothetical protein